MKHIAFICILVLSLGTAWPVNAVARNIVVEVTGGKVSLTDCIVEQKIDLNAAAQILGDTTSIAPHAVRVVETGPAGEELATMVSQADPTDGRGEYVVCWQIPGELAAGQTRRSGVLLHGKGLVPVPPEPIRARTEGGETTVECGRVALTYSKGAGGFVAEATVNGVSAALSWADKVFDGAVYYLANHSAKRVRLTASGPLRVQYETEGDYRDGDKTAPSHPRATYTFTHYAGDPLTYVRALVTQDFAHPWISLHFVEIHFDGAPIDRYASDEGGRGPLKQAGEFHGAREWAAVYGDRFLTGVCDSSSPGVWDGGGVHYGAYIRSATAPWSSLSYPWKCALLWGTGERDLELLQQRSKVVSNPPTVRVSVAPLDQQVKTLTSVLADKERGLRKLSGRAWAVHHVGVVLGRVWLKVAADKAGAGEFGKALQALSAAKSVLQPRGSSADLKTTGTVTAGLVNGHPFLTNDKAAYVWTLPKDGAGLLSIYDRKRHREFLKADPQAATFWQIAVRKGAGGRSYTNVGTVCKVTGMKGGLELKWEGPIQVRVRAQLRADEALVRLRLVARPTQPDEGLLTVTFPIMHGILPITPEGTGDVILDTWGMGEKRPSPLASGQVVQVDYPHGMQFTALVADGVGLYLAEEDGEANRKGLTWSPRREEGTLEFNISHPVLGWGGKSLVKEYVSPGDVVIGPFRGDWFDAAQLYRRWAITAPWCAKGPIHSRRDYPRWLAEAPYWTIGHLAGEEGIEQEIKKFEFFGLPVGVCHTYGYFFPQHQDDRYPEYFPPRLGSEGLKKTVERLQGKGMRLVPYVNGWLWDQDTESYRVENAAQNAAMHGPTGNLTVHTSYGFGQSLVAMCPGSPLWRRKLLDISKELVGRYGFDGVYYDFLTIHTSDCYNESHGHPLCGGKYWTHAVHDLYRRIREELKRIRPDAMLTGEDNAEYVMDVLDTALVGGQVGTRTPLYQAVYHGYTLVYGGYTGNCEPYNLGRWWLMGNQNGWNNWEPVLIGKPPYENWAKHGLYYRKLLHCHHRFARPYLAYGEMLRPPRIEGDLSTVTGQSAYGPYTIPVVEGSAWRAPDGSVGVFFLNYDDKPHEFTWSVDLAEGAGWKSSAKAALSEWTEESGLQAVAHVVGGRLTRKSILGPRGLMALKLEVNR